jgi:hypothetical protein
VKAIEIEAKTGHRDESDLLKDAFLLVHAEKIEFWDEDFGDSENGILIVKKSNF